MWLLWLADPTADIVMFHVVLVLMFASSALLGVVGIQITDLRVPAAVRNDSGAPALLDCEYSVKPEEQGLVVKWYFNNSPSPVYQWIPGKKPQDLGVLRGRLDLSYRASNHQLYMHRALYIRNPTTELSGEYKCLVSTFNDEDFMVKRMVVFAAPQKDIVMTWRTSEESNIVNLSCWTRDVYPQPKMFLYMESNVDEPLPDVQVMIVRKRHAFDISAHKLFDSREVVVPTIFHCELRIPEANYVIRKSLVFYPGVPFPITDAATRIAWDLMKLLFIIAAATLC